MKRLQKREKVLLIVLVVLLLTVLPFVLLIYPAMQQNQQKQVAYQDLQAARLEMETTLKTKPLLEETLAGLEQKYASAESAIPAQMKNYDIHYFVNDICTKAGVTLDALSIGDYEAVEPAAEDAQDSGSDNTQDDAQTGGAQNNVQASALLSRAVLQLTVAGTFDQVMNVLDQFSDLEYTVVTDFYIDLADAAQQSATVITVELYSLPLPG